MEISFRFVIYSCLLSLFLVLTMCRLRSVASAFRYYRPMPDTDSALYDLIVAPILAAVFAFHYHRPMLDTDTALCDLIVAPVLAAVFAFNYSSKEGL